MGTIEEQLNKKSDEEFVQYNLPVDSDLVTKKEARDTFRENGLNSLIDLKDLAETVTTIPSFTPTRFYDQFKIYVDSVTSPIVKRFYWYSNKTNTWMYTSVDPTEYDNGNISGTATIDWSKGTTQYATMTGSVTLTFSNPVSGRRYVLHLAGAYTPTFPSTVRWSAGTTPTATATSGKKDIYTFIYSGKESLYDGLQSPNYTTS